MLPVTIHVMERTNTRNNGNTAVVDASECSGETLPSDERCVVLDSKAVDKPGQRTWLHQEREGLAQLGFIGQILLDALSAEPDWERVDAALSFYGGVRLTNERATEIVLPCTTGAIPAWPASLGDAYAPGETGRTLTVRINHAPWRDSATKRLVGVTVESGVHANSGDHELP